MLSKVQGVKASLAIGGWTGSQWFSSNVGSSKNRTAFVTSVSSLISTYGLDGVDFEYVLFSILSLLHVTHPLVGSIPDPRE